MSVDETFNNSVSEELDQSLTYSFEEKLLSEVRKIKSLYCSHDPNYNNMAKNRLAWLLIAENCKKTVSECVKKWHSLLRIYFSSSPEIAWVHIDNFLAFEPYLSNHKLQTPSKVQRDELLKELWYRSTDLHKPESTPEERQQIWLQVASKCNAITPGVIMSNINWQKYWLYMKQNFGVRLYTVRSRHYKKQANVAEKYTEEEVKILEICQATPWDSMTSIITALGKNFELGTNRESLVFRCKKCLEQPDEILFNGCCSNCCEKPIFCSICEIGGALTKFKLADWSEQALDLLPFELTITSPEEISVCSKCSDNLNKKATLNWKICRVCESNIPSNLEYLYNYKLCFSLRKAFKESTKFEFNEKDGLPGYICRNCKVQINKVNEFVMKFKRTQNRLMHIHLINFIGNTEGKVLDQAKEKKVQGFSDPLFILQDKNKQSNINKPMEALTKLPTNIREVKMYPNTNEVVPARSPGSYNIIPVQSPESKQIEKTSMPLTATDSPEVSIKDVFSLQSRSQQKIIQSSRRIVPVAVAQFGKMNSNTILNKNVPKTVSTFPTSMHLNMKTKAQPALRSEKLQKLIQLIQKPEPIKAIKLKPTTASKPAIFTIPRDTPSALSEPVPSPIATDYETIEDAPPVFCIPKNIIKTENCPSAADKQLMDFNPCPSKVIKIEKPDNDEEIPITSCNLPLVEPTENLNRYFPVKEIPAVTSNVPLVESVNNLKTHPEKQNQKEQFNLKSKNNTRIVRIKGQLVTVKPHPYIPGAYVPADYNGEQQKPGTGCPIRLRTPIIRKVNTTKNTIHIAKPINIVQEKIPMIPAKGELQGIKKPRKYWGTVDNFQVSPLTPKIMARIHQPNQKQAIHFVEKNCYRASLDNSSIQNPSKAQIKEEIRHNDDISDASESHQHQYSTFNRNTKNETLRNHLNLTSSFKMKKLRINMKQDKRIRMLASKSKKLCLMQSAVEGVPVLSTRAI